MEYGTESWERFIDERGKRKVGFHFMLRVAQVDPRAILVSGLERKCAQNDADPQLIGSFTRLYPALLPSFDIRRPNRRASICGSVVANARVREASTTVATRFSSGSIFYLAYRRTPRWVGSKQRRRDF